MKLKAILSGLLLIGPAMHADVVSAAFTAGAAVTSNGSVISLGQPFVGRIQGPGLTLEIGILTLVPPLVDPPPPQELYANGNLLGRIEFSESQIRFVMSGLIPVGSYQLEFSEDLLLWEILPPDQFDVWTPLEGQMFMRVMLLPR